MTPNQYHDSVIDYEILNRVIKDSKCTKYVKQYSLEFRIEIYILRTKHNLSYRMIIEYCQYKYALSPSIGHIKNLIQDGKEASETNKGNSENMSKKGCDNESTTDNALSENEPKCSVRNKLKSPFPDVDPELLKEEFGW